MHIKFIPQWAKTSKPLKRSLPNVMHTKLFSSYVFDKVTSSMSAFSRIVSLTKVNGSRKCVNVLASYIVYIEMVDSPEGEVRGRRYLQILKKILNCAPFGSVSTCAPIFSSFLSVVSSPLADNIFQIFIYIETLVSMAFPPSPENSGNKERENWSWTEKSPATPCTLNSNRSQKSQSTPNPKDSSTSQKERERNQTKQLQNSFLAPKTHLLIILHNPPDYDNFPEKPDLNKEIKMLPQTSSNKAPTNKKVFFW